MLIFSTLEARGGKGSNINTPLNFFGFKFLLRDGLSKALIQLFFVHKYIFYLQLTDVIVDDVITISYAICVLTAKFQFLLTTLH